MEIRVNLDNIWTDYEETVTSIVRAEIESSIRAEVRSIIRKAMKEQAESLRKTIEAEVRKVTPRKFAKLLTESGESI